MGISAMPSSHPAPVRPLVVIPTRNRPDLAARTIRSVLAQEGGDLQVLVSDNSTMDQAVRDLATTCEQLGDRRLHYIRPPTPLSMSRHWEYALSEASRFLGFSHVLYLTDRMLLKHHALKTLADLAAAYPDAVINY